jgi:RNA polymerase sigma-70 factor, ECF subfamily
LVDKAQDDIRIIQEVARAETTALEALYDRYGKLVFSLAVHILGDNALAEEVTQDVFIQVWNKAETFDVSQGKVSTWISSVARHRAIDVLRHREHRPEGHSVDWEDPLVEQSSSELRVEVQVDLLQQRAVILKILSGLPIEQRKVLGMAYFRGMTQQEIATFLNEPLGTIKTRLRLGMQKVKNLLDESGFSF